MSGLQGRERLQPSVLDRLIDHAPNRKKDGPDGSFTTAQFRQCVLRDLTWLLNTSNLSTLTDLSLIPLVAKSTLNFGIPGFAGLLESYVKSGTLETELANAVRAYEPRIRPDSLKVKSQASRQSGSDTTLVFTIEGELWAQPAPLQLFLETSIEVETRQAVVSEIKETR